MKQPMFSANGGDEYLGDTVREVATKFFKARPNATEVYVRLVELAPASLHSGAIQIPYSGHWSVYVLRGSQRYASDTPASIVHAKHMENIARQKKHIDNENRKARLGEAIFNICKAYDWIAGNPIADQLIEDELIHLEDVKKFLDQLANEQRGQEILTKRETLMDNQMIGDQMI